MIYNTTTIIGLGIIGGSIASSLKKYKVTGKVIGITRSDAYQRAQKAGLIDSGYSVDNIETGVKKADLVILAVPIRKICALIPEIISMVKQDCTITDVGSTKHAIIEVSNTFNRKDVHFVGGHPIVDSEKTGFEAGDADLFKKRPYALIRNKFTPDEIFNKMYTLVEKIGAIPIELDSITHDRLVSGISHLPQMLAVSLINVLGRQNDIDDRQFKISSPAFKEMTRLAGSAYSVWEEIIISNRLNISNMIDILTDELKQLKSSINKLSLNKDFEQANIYRKQLLNAAK